MVSFEKFEEMVKLMDKDGDGSVDKVRAVPPPPLSLSTPPSPSPLTTRSHLFRL